MSDLLFDVKDGIATITLNRPKKLNAFSMEMIQEWIKALEEIRDNDEIRVGIVTGSGRAFCAGGDVKTMAKGEGFFDAEDVDVSTTALNRKHSLWKYVQRIPLLMQEIDKPMIAQINGDAIGAGLDMALMCDLRYISKEARVGETYIKVGIVPGDGGAYFLPRLIRLDKALELFWTGKIIGAEEAAEIGIVTYTVEKDELEERVAKMAKTLAAGPQQSLRLTKRAVYQSENVDLRTSLDMISSSMGLVTELPDYKEGVQAVIEKRKPEFE